MWLHAWPNYTMKNIGRWLDVKLRSPDPMFLTPWDAPLWSKRFGRFQRTNKIMGMSLEEELQPLGHTWYCYRLIETGNYLIKKGWKHDVHGPSRTVSKRLKWYFDSKFIHLT